MSPGKIVAQAGHAFLGTFLQCRDTALIEAYHRDFPASPGTKICLRVPNLDQLLDAERQALSAGIAIFRVVDSGCLNFFGGRPIITALGLGPVTELKSRPILGKFRLL